MNRHTAVVTSAGSLSYGGVARHVADVQRRLASRRSVAGQVIGVPATNDLTSVVHALALPAAGAIPLLLDPRGTESERRTVVELAGATEVRRTEPLGSLDSDGGAGAWPPRRVERGAVVLVTSGTNGISKVVQRDLSAAVRNARAFAEAARYRPDDVILCTTALFHSYAVTCALLPAMEVGATLVLAPAPSTASGVAALAAETKPTVLLSTPFLYRMLLSGADLGWSAGVRLFVSAGEPLSDSLEKEWRSATGRTLRDHYGTTEVGAISLDTGSDAAATPRLLPGVEASVAGEGGELLVRAPGERSRYLGAPRLDQEAFRGGWYHTGDYGRVRPDGQIEVHGRLHRRLIVAGRNVDPVEVERAVEEIDGIHRCVVAQEQQPQGRVVAFVVADARHTEFGLRQRLSGRLAGYKIPNRFYLVPEIPITGSGKVRLGALWTSVSADGAGEEDAD